MVCIYYYNNNNNMTIIIINNNNNSILYKGNITGPIFQQLDMDMRSSLRLEMWYTHLGFGGGFEAQREW